MRKKTNFRLLKTGKFDCTQNILYFYMKTKNLNFSQIVKRGSINTENNFEES